MIPFFSIIIIGMAVMLGIMGVQQMKRGYRVAAGFSMVICVILLAASVALLVHTI